MSEFGGSKCGGGTVRVVVIRDGGPGQDMGCYSIPSSYQSGIDYSTKEPIFYGTPEDTYEIIYGPLEEGQYYDTQDINGDGSEEVFKATMGDDGTEQIITVYGFDNEGNKTETEFNEWQYNSFIDEFEKILTSETPSSSAAQDLFERYENAGIADNTFIQNSFNFTDPQQIIDRTILGDGDIGVTVDVCTKPGQTNCVDPKAINDLWEDFGRHIRVIFKGLNIPGLPDWLPLPGIMRVPTIGEIWDKITGPFNDAAREQMKECMDKDDDGDGVNNTASYCMENRDIVGIITQGILDGTGDIVDATTDAMGKIVDKALETLDCVADPAACARTIKDTIEGVLGGADPTQPGLPPWMRAIIIGSQYGDEILKELEKIFGEDLDDDGEIGVVPDDDDSELDTFCKQGYPEGALTFGLQENQQRWEYECSDKYCRDGTLKPENGVCPGDEEPWTNEGPTAEECAREGKEHIPSNEAQKKDSECGGCLEGFTEIDGHCQDDDDPTENEGPTAEE